MAVTQYRLGVSFCLMIETCIARYRESNVSTVWWLDGYCVWVGRWGASDSPL